MKIKNALKFLEEGRGRLLRCHVCGEFEILRLDRSTECSDCDTTLAHFSESESQIEVRIYAKLVDAFGYTKYMRLDK